MNPAAALARFIEYGKQRGGVHFYSRHQVHIHTRHPEMRWRFVFTRTADGLATLSHFNHDWLTEWMDNAPFQSFSVEGQALNILSGRLMVRFAPLSERAQDFLGQSIQAHKAIQMQRIMLNPLDESGDPIPVGRGRLIRCSQS